MNHNVPTPALPPMAATAPPERMTDLQPPHHHPMALFSLQVLGPEFHPSVQNPRSYISPTDLDHEVLTLQFVDGVDLLAFLCLTQKVFLSECWGQWIAN